MKGKKVYSWQKKLKLLEKNIKKKKVRKILIQPKFQGSLKDLFRGKRKVNLTQSKLDNTSFVKVNESTFTPLLKYIARLVKARILRKIKYFRTKKFKLFKGPKPKKFSKFHKRNYSKVFKFRFFTELKNQPLYFVFLKRFFRWYFLFSNKQLSFLKNLVKHKRTAFFDFVSLFESRALNVLIRSGMSPNPVVSKFLFSLNCIWTSHGVLRDPNAFMKPGMLLFLRPSFVPYSLYRYYINY
jgi:hypothetical protein